jgi:hypothetical protein
MQVDPSTYGSDRFEAFTPNVVVILILYVLGAFFYALFGLRIATVTFRYQEHQALARQSFQIVWLVLGFVFLMVLNVMAIAMRTFTGGYVNGVLFFLLYSLLPRLLELGLGWYMAWGLLTNTARVEKYGFPIPLVSVIFAALGFILFRLRYCITGKLADDEYEFYGTVHITKEYDDFQVGLMSDHGGNHHHDRSRHQDTPVLGINSSTTGMM